MVKAGEMQAEIERLGRELNLAKYGEPDFSWSIHKEAMSDLLARAEKAEAARDEARAEIERLIKERDDMKEIAESLAETGSALIVNLQEGEFISTMREQEWLEALRALKGSDQ